MECFIFILQKMTVKVFQSKSKQVKEVEKEPIEIKVLEKYSPEIIEFDSKEEFAEYLAENIDEMNKMTTQKLNMTYLIKGYRIIKLKEKISLKKDSSETKTETDLKSEINEIKTMMSQLMNLLNDG